LVLFSGVRFERRELFLKIEWVAAQSKRTLWREACLDFVMNANATFSLSESEESDLLDVMRVVEGFADF
jgi:hypothetical protein